MIKIPDKYYIGVHHNSNNGTIPLAFATPHGTDSAFNKRKATVDAWCNLGHSTYPGTADVHDNVLLEGFRISESIRRTSSWNGGNVVWRVVDPRGFELEIQSGNFANIVDCTTIVNGEIQGKCVWGREGSTNVLLPEASAPYQEAVNFTQLSKKKVSKKALAIGQRVRMKDDKIAYYLGDYYGFAAVLNHPHVPNNYSNWNNKTYEAASAITPKFLNKRCAFLLESFLPQFNQTGDFSACRNGVFSFADVKNVAEILDGSIVVDQQLVIDEALRNVNGRTFIFSDLPSAVSLSAFKKVEFKVVDGELIDRGIWLMESHTGKVVQMYDQNFHVTKHMYNQRDYKPDRDLYALSMPFDVTRLQVGKPYEERARFPREEHRKSLPLDYFADWTQKTLVAVLDDAVEAPLQVRYYGRRTGVPLTQLHTFAD